MLGFPLFIDKSRTFPGFSRTPMRNFPGPFQSPRMLKYKEEKKQQGWGSWVWGSDCQRASSPPARRSGGVLQAPLVGSGAEPRKI